VLSDLNQHAFRFRFCGQHTYPHSDADLTVIYASDDDDPRVTTVPYSTYALIPKDDTISMWRQLVEDLK